MRVIQVGGKCLKMILYEIVSWEVFSPFVKVDRVSSGVMVVLRG